MSSIKVSKEHGVNPTMAVCARCGKDTGELLLLGRCNEYTCNDCGAQTYGLLKKGTKCKQCASMRLRKTGTDIEAPMHLKLGLCKECVDRDKEHAALVRQGGVYWRCQACGSFGVIRPGTGMAIAARHTAQIAAPKPVGVDFTPQECPVCTERMQER